MRPRCAEHRSSTLLLKLFYMLFYKRVRFMEGLSIYPDKKKKLRYKLHNHVLGD